MKSNFLLSLQLSFSPLSGSRAHRIPRLLLARLPAKPLNASGVSLPITTTILPAQSTEPARMKITFKGGEVLEMAELTRRRKTKKGLVEEQIVPAGTSEGVLDLGKLGMKDVLEEVDRRCRVLGRKDAITG